MSFVVAHNQLPTTDTFVHLRMCMNQQVKKFIFLLRQGTMHPTTYILSIYQRLVHFFLSFAIGIPETMHPSTCI